MVRYLRAAVQDDINWILAGENIIESPIYGVLNLCRYLAHQEQGWQQPMSKGAGATWALGHVPKEHCQIVAQARACYPSDEPVSADERRHDGHLWDIEALTGFRDYVLCRQD